ncbi:MAG: response regulator [Ignavibacteriae bacterium]|nr:response regulator [Ignavibacteriota bacterium]NOG97299.1 response regulator [Ignavibacteriota bacterium]
MKEKIRTIIIDDEKLAREIVKNYLSKEENLELIEECTNGFEAIKAINELKPDLIFLDIQMPKINGFEMLELIDEPPVIIFTTAFDQYALKAFEVNAADYLLKPFSHERFNDAVSKAATLLKDKDSNREKIENIVKHIDEQDEFIDRVVVKTNQKISIIPTEQINYIQAQDDYVMLFTEQGKFLKQKTMKFFESRLNPAEFIRLHRSYISKLDRINEINLLEKETYQVTLKDGEKLPVSRSGYAKLKEVLE